MSRVIRCCGERVSGGVYISVPGGPDGLPVEHFFVDAPQVLDVDALGISAIGTYLIEVGEHTHVVDIVGSENYPYPADFIEETRRFGLSRRIARTTDFSRLQPGSRILVAHAKAYIENTDEYHVVRGPGEHWCPKQIEEHVDATYTGMCSSILYEDLTGVPASHPDAPDGALCGSIRSDIIGVAMHRRRHESRSLVRTLPAFSYRGLSRPAGVTPRYQVAVFLSLPIGRLEVIRDSAASSHESALDLARKSGIEVSLEEQ